MSKWLQWEDWYNHTRNREGAALEINEESIAIALSKKQERESGWLIKILSVIGGILGNLFFTFFLTIIFSNDSGMSLLVIGIFMMGSAILFIRNVNLLVLDTLVITAYLLAYIISAIGLDRLGWKEPSIALVILGFAVAAIFFIRHSILLFFTFAIALGAVVFLFFNQKLGVYAQIWPCMLAIVILYLYWKEAAWITAGSRLNDWYRPLLWVLVLYFIGFLQLLGKRHWVEGIGEYFSYTSLWLMAILGWVVYQILPQFSITQSSSRGGLLVIIIWILLPTLRSPAIAGILLLLLLSYRSGDRWVWLLSLLAMVVFFSEFYYDLSLSLLTKSYILMGSGIGLLLLYYFTRKYWQSNEVE